MTEADSPEAIALGAHRKLWARRGSLRGNRGGFSLRRVILAGLGICGGLAMLATIGVGLVAWRLNDGPIALDWLGPRIKTALDERLKQGYSFELGEAMLDKGEHGPAVTVTGLKLKDPSGRVLLTAPKAAVAVNGYAAAVGSIVPTRLELTGLDVQFAVAADGGISVSAGGAEGLPLSMAVAQPAPPPPPPAPGGESPAVPARPAPEASQTGPVAASARALQRLLDAVSDPDSPLGALDHFSITHGRLVFDDPTEATRTVLDGLDVKFDRTGAQTQLALSVKGPAGDWSLNAQSTGLPGEERRLQAEIRDISLDEIGLATGSRARGIESDMPISASLAAVQGADGTVSEARAKFAFGAGFLKLDSAEPEAWQVDEITGSLSFDPRARRIRVEALRLDAGQTHFGLHGAIAPPDAANADWALELASDDSALGPERPGEAPVALTSVALSARYSGAQNRLVIDHLDFEGPELGVKVSALMTGLDARPALKLDAGFRRMPMRVALRLWPGFLAPDARAWFIEHLHGGVMDTGAMKLDYDAATFADVRARRPLPDSAGRFDFTVTNGGIDTMPGLPPLSGVDGAGHVTGRTASFVATRGVMELGGGKKLVIPDGAFTIKDVEAKPAPATLLLHVQSNMEAMSALFTRDALKTFRALPPDSQGIKGQVDAQLTFDLKLAKKMGPDDIALRATANLSAVSIDNFIGKEKLDNATLAVTFAKDGLRAKGEGRAFGTLASVEIKKPAGAAGEAVVSLTLDEAARARLGFSLGAGLSGPVLARLTSPAAPSDDIKARVELDLTRAAIDGLLPGWSKPAGKPGKASFSLLASGDTLRLEQIALDAGGVSFGGAAQFTAEGKFVSARLTGVKLGIGEDMQADANVAGDALKIVLKGNSIDARPFLSALVSQQGDGRGPKDVDFELRASALVGHNKQSLANAEVKLARRGGQLRSLQVNGRFGAEPFNASLIKKDGPASIVARTQDAGAALSYFDLYRRMQGGTLDLVMRLGDGRQEGTVAIQDFVLKDEPAMQRLAANGAIPAGNGAAQAGQIDPASVPFTKMTANFVRAGGRTDIRDGVMFGQQIGATMSGSVDFARNLVDLNGAFVPAYELNNLFARVPVLGPLLGGNKNEGLFALNYRVTGPASAPVLHINPLSAIAPGFLRTIFGAVDGTRPLAGPVGEAVVVPLPR